jgi:hypothetical protein
MRRVLALFLITAAAVVAAPAIASGGDNEDDLFVELVSPVEPLTFLATFEEDESCVDGDFEALIEANEVEVTPISVTQQADPDEFLIVLPSDTPPGELFVEIECDNGDGDTTESGSVLWASIPVTKVVSGPAPSTATFTVHLDCVTPADEEPALPEELPQNFIADLHYGVAGGLKYVYTDHGGVCTVTEPVNGGATSVTISPEVVDTIPAPALYPDTVTNTFAAAVQPNFTG